MISTCPPLIFVREPLPDDLEHGGQIREDSIKGP